MRALQHGHETGVDVLYDGEKIVGRRPGAQLVPASARELVTSTHAMLPRVGIAALIIDVARDIPFMDELRHAGGQQARSPTRRGQLFAALVACATGMGYTRMAEASKFTERQLREAAERHCTIEHLAAADALVCEAIRGLAQASTIDLERISSSDGQRYPIIGRSALAGFAAREAGYRRRMVTWMIWINEQYAHFGSKVISVTEREGLHTLDAIVLADDAPEIHTADTHGATELVFAGFDLLGRRFIPRLSDIADVPLYGLGPGQPQLAADMLLARKVRDEVIAGQWEELLRLAGSIKRGWIVPSILLTRMHPDGAAAGHDGPRHEVWSVGRAEGVSATALVSQTHRGEDDSGARLDQHQVRRNVHRRARSEHHGICRRRSGEGGREGEERQVPGRDSVVLDLQVRGHPARRLRRTLRHPGQGLLGAGQER